MSVKSELGQAVLFVYDESLRNGVAVTEFIEGKHALDPFHAAEALRNGIANDFPDGILSIGMNDRARQLMADANMRAMGFEVPEETNVATGTKIWVAFFEPSNENSMVGGYEWRLDPEAASAAYNAWAADEDYDNSDLRLLTFVYPSDLEYNAENVTYYIERNVDTFPERDKVGAKLIASRKGEK